MQSAKTRRFSKTTVGSAVAASLLGASVGYTISNPAFAAEEETELLTGGVTLVAQQVNSDDETAGDFGSSLSVDINIEKDVGDGKAIVYINHAEGFDPSPGANGDFEGDPGTGMPGEEGFTDTRVAEALFETPLGEELTGAIGKISPQRYFDTNNLANDPTRQFLGSPFINNLAIDFPGHSPIHSYAAGAYAGFAMSESLIIQGALFEDAQEYAGVFKNTFLIGEVDWTGDLMDEYETNVRLMYWQSEANDSNGFAVSADLAFSEEYLFFVRYGQKSLPGEPPEGMEVDDLNSSTGTAISGGLQALVAEEFTVGLGYAITSPNESALEDGTALDDETWLEVYVSYELGEGVLIAADYQQIKSPGFDSAAGTVTTLGGRLQIDF